MIPREAHREGRRTSVLDAAERLLERAGLAGFSMRQLASESGIPAPTLYGYFASRDDVLEAVTLRRLAVIREYLDPVRETPVGGSERVIAYAVAYRQYALDHPDDYELVMTRASRKPTASYRDVFDAVAAEIPDGGALDEMVNALWALAHGFVSLELRGLMLEAESRETRDLAYRRWIAALLASGDLGHTRAESDA